MAFPSGARLGPYEIAALIGAGGMGEVYRARDTRLNRDVALKVIAPAYALDAERLARFRREAQIVASLNHPHIGAIYGFEDGGETHALVLELVAGDTLADRIARGPIPLEDALPIARQICEALEAAHEQGIIHRDLKPANIKVTPDGVVKVLDFGLAKLAQPEAAAGHADFTASPTITSPAVMTGVGVLLGTAAYMSPEQAKGREADRRSDIWAFGCVLYEMLTGRRAFDGEDMTEVLGAVVRLEPNWEALASSVPPTVRTLLQRCLVKDRRRRLAHIAAALFALDHQAVAAGAGASPSAAVARRSPWFHTAALTAGALMVVILGAALGWFARSPAPPPVIRTTIVTSGITALTLSPDGGRNVAITPDGSRIVYGGNNQLLVRALDQLEPTVLSGLGTPRGAFISPDGQWVAFFAGPSGLRKVAITGGSPLDIAAVTNPRGATWGPDGTIVFATATVATGLERVSDGGGEVTVLTKPDRERDEGDHLWPEFLPGGKAVLFTITAVGGGIDDAQIAVLDLQTRTWKRLIRGGSHAHYVPTGHLIYGFQGTLRAVAFDLGRLEVVGTPEPVLEGVVTTATGAAEIAVGANGSLVYVPGSFSDIRQTVVSVDRQGHASPLPNLPADSYRYVRVSPDGARLALATQNAIWIYDFAREVMTLLTDHPAPELSPLWTPDGTRIIFTSRRTRHQELFWRLADGTGSEERLLGRGELIDLMANGWSRDGTHLLFTEVSSPAKLVGMIGQVALGRPSDVRVLVNNGANNGRATVSPGGDWMAYDSNLSGRPEIYVERYPGRGNRQTISTGGGRLPLWSRNGQELFFSTPDGRQMLAVSVQGGATLVAGRPKMLFELAMLPPVGGARPYDIAPDGRFLIIRRDPAGDTDSAPSNLIVVQNWLEELKRLMPTN